MRRSGRKLRDCHLKSALGHYSHRRGLSRRSFREGGPGSLPYDISRVQTVVESTPRVVFKMSHCTCKFVI